MVPQQRVEAFAFVYCVAVPPQLAPTPLLGHAASQIYWLAAFTRATPSGRVTVHAAKCHPVLKLNLHLVVMSGEFVQLAERKSPNLIE
jgi:hypothetical protein